MAKKGNISQLVVQAEELALEASARRCPVVLREVAARRRVTEVVFGPLLVDALLTTHPLGFRIFFRSNRDEIQTLREAYETESLKKLLPSRIRFSLAHELAHTLFYDLSKARPESKESATEVAVNDLEVACNRLASHLLMPTEMLKIEIIKLPDLKPGAVLGAAARFGVSPETLIYRLQGSGLLTEKHDLRGCIVALLNTSSGCVVKAIARPQHINTPSEINTVKEGELWRVGRIAWDSIFDGKDAGKAVLPLTLKTSRVSEQKDFVFEFVRYSGWSDGDFYLATVDMAGPP